MESKNSLFDRIFFFTFSVAISLFAYFFTVYFSFTIIVKVIGGTITVGQTFIIGGVSMVLASLIFYYLFRFLLHNLIDKSLSGSFMKIIRAQQSLVKTSLILDRGEETYSTIDSPKKYFKNVGRQSNVKNSTKSK